MNKNTNTLRGLALGLAAVTLGTAASLHAAPSAAHRTASVMVSDTTPKDTTTKPDTTKPDTTKK